MSFILPKTDVCFKELFRDETICKHFIHDVLGIPLEKIKSVRQGNPFLWRNHKHQKQGILDIFLELHNHTKINIEIQLKHPKHWDKRQLFYLSKMYTADLRVGEDYSKLNHCISIALLDFNLSNRPEYHCIYKLRDKHGNIFTNIFEIHTIELRKALTDNHPLNDWIRFFNAKSEEDLAMIKTKNPGIQRAIEELKYFSLNPHLKLRFEAYLKAKRDQRAIEEYARDEAIAEGLAIGIEQGIAQGIEQGIAQAKEHNIRILILDNIENGTSRELILSKLTRHFSLTEEDATKYYEKYSTPNGESP